MSLPFKILLFKTNHDSLPLILKLTNTPLSVHPPENGYQNATCSVTNSATYRHTFHATKFNGAETTSGFTGLQATTHNTQ
jgi:hypothetical protein